MSVFIRNFLAASMLVLTACGSNAFGADNTWLVGKWEMTYDPDGGTKDWVQFTDDGDAYSIGSSGPLVPGTYSVSGDSVNIVYTFHGKSIPLSLTISNDKKKLLNYSKKTGNTSEYQKVQE